MLRIPYAKPSISDLEVRYATDAAKNGWGENCNDYIDQFETLFRNHLVVDHAIATSSCTGALHLGMAALDIKQGDEVILADTNWIATASPIVNLGATPVFVDILPDSWCLDPEAVELAINQNTKAIVAVHLYGNLCDMERLISIGQRYNLPIIEDAAEAIGSIYKGTYAGSMGLFGSFSFHGSKTLTTGEGGMFVTDNTDLYQKVLTLSNHGRDQAQMRQFWPDVVGYKYKMSNLQAAVGCAQIQRMNELVSGKRRVFEYYKYRLDGLPLTMNPEPPETRNGYWMPNIIVDEGVNFSRENLLADFKEEGIDGRVFFWPLSMLPMFKDSPQNKISYSLCIRGVNLPTYHDLTEKDMDRVVKVISRHIN
tara:strand:- start:866 stop:1966 length:1101 start_codon:yes stop_codon:yes gene_type:complete